MRGVLAAERRAHEREEIAVARAGAHRVAQRELGAPKETDLGEGGWGGRGGGSGGLAVGGGGE